MRLRDVTLPDGRRRDVLVEGDRIAAIDRRLEGEPVIDAEGRLLMPGGIDVHVHFREPGAPHKETWATGTRAAAAGGVTTVIDQPNTDPPTVDGRTFRRKLARAEATAIVDFGINGGVTPRWHPPELLSEPIAALGEVFLADSTGNLGIDSELFERSLEVATTHDILVTVHAEDDSYFDREVTSRTDPDAWSAYRPPDAEIGATKRACRLAEAHGVDLHFAHLSTADAIDEAVRAGHTCEVTPHHLLLSRDDLASLGTYGRMNPPLRSDAERRAVFDRVLDGSVTMVASDHAPHTRQEKETDVWSAPSGVPGVETMVPLLVAQAVEGPFSLADVARLTARRPAERFGLDGKGRLAPGYDADLVILDTDHIRELRADELFTACGWTPFEGYRAVLPEVTILRGAVAYRNPEAAVAVPTAVDADGFGPTRGRNVKGPAG